jgi:hypothetical protein
VNWSAVVLAFVPAEMVSLTSTTRVVADAGETAVIENHGVLDEYREQLRRKIRVAFVESRVVLGCKNRGARNCLSHKRQYAAR